MRQSTMALIISILWGLVAYAQPGTQRGDQQFQPQVKNPEFSKGTGPVVAIDAAHRNFHTKQGRYRPLAAILEADGCRVRSHNARFSEASLAALDILVVANPLPVQLDDPITSAFEPAEINCLVDWIRGGGSLMLIADHRPYGEAARELASAFGVRMSGGFVVDQDEPGPIEFARSTGQLHKHPITEGALPAQRIDKVMSFTGQALQAGAELVPLMTLDEHSILFARRPNPAQQIEQRDVSGWHQGLAGEIGQGRLAVFGEAAMFSAQLSVNDRPMGLNAPGAEQNQQFLLNVIHWLAKEL